MLDSRNTNPGKVAHCSAKHHIKQCNAASLCEKDAMILDNNIMRTINYEEFKTKTYVFYILLAVAPRHACGRKGADC